MAFLISILLLCFYSYTKQETEQHNGHPTKPRQEQTQITESCWMRLIALVRIVVVFGRNLQFFFFSLAFELTFFFF